MYRILPPPLLALALLSAITVSTFVHFVPILLLAVLKIAIPHQGWRHWWTQWLVVVAETWVRGNNLLVAWMLPTRFDLRGLDDPRLRRDGRYLIISNHQTWADVMVLQRALIHHAPFLRFFVKSVLIWFPLLGFAWWALDMPFMKRYSAATLKKKPHLRGKDIETTRKACQHYRHGPISILNFAEGTRFEPRKRDEQQSPYRHLLKPRAGGLAAVLDALSGELDTLVDVTVVYSRPGVDFWDFLQGRVERIVVEVHVEDVPEDVRRGDYGADEGYRDRVQAWLREMWDRKDARIEAVLSERAAR